LAEEQWTPRIIEAALHGESGDIIPALNKHRLIRVSMPLYLIRLLDHLARTDTHRVPRNASDIVERAMTEFASSYDAAVLDVAIPGFAQALQYPYFTPRAIDVYRRCRYCAISITEATREVCRECKRRHEPDEHLGEYGLPELDREDA